MISRQTVIALLVWASVGFAGAEPQLSVDVSLVRSNTRLREYFLRRLRFNRLARISASRPNGFRNPAPGMRPPPSGNGDWSEPEREARRRISSVPNQLEFSPAHVDRMIDHFFGQLQGKLLDLKVSFNEALEARKESLESSRSLSPGAERQRLEWKASLKEISDSAGDIRDMLAPIFREFKDRCKDQILVQTGPQNRGREVEMREIRRLIMLVEGRLDSLLGGGPPIIASSDLQDGNVLLHLDHLKKLSSKLSKSL